jgi:hypothetical protein
MIKVAADAAVLKQGEDIAAADEGLRGGGESRGQFQCLTIIPLNDDHMVSAVVYLRCNSPDLDSNAGDRWDVKAYLDGTLILEDAGHIRRRTAVNDAVSHLAAAAAQSRKKDYKAAAEFLAAYLKDMNGFCEDQDYGPEADDCDGGIWGVVVGEEVAEEVIEEEVAEDVAVQAPACGGEGSVSAETIAAFHARLDDAKNELADAAVELSKIEETYKSAKERFKTAIESITNIASRGPEPMPLFDKKPGERNEAAQQPPQAGVGEASDHQPINTAWRASPIEVLGLPPKLTERLTESGCVTIGALEDQRGSFDGLRGIKGIGEAKVTLIEDALLKWLDVNRDAAVMASVK